MLNRLGENLNMLMASAKVNSDELARKIGVPATTIKRIRNNEQANPTISTLLPIANFFSISLNQLLGPNDLVETGKNNQVELKASKVPLLTLSECIKYEEFDHHFESRYVFTERIVREKSFALKVDIPDLEELPRGCILIVDPSVAPQNGDYIIATKAGLNVASIRKYITEIDQIYLKPLIAGLAVSILSPEYKVLGVIIQYKVELRSN